MTFSSKRALAKLLLISALLLPSGIFFKAQAQAGIIGQENPRIDLNEAINIALANNTKIKRALLSLRDADQQVRAAWSSVMPNVSSNLNYTRNLEIPVNFVPAKIFDPSAPEGEMMPLAFGTDNNWMGGFSASQILFNGRAFVGISSADIYKAAQTEGLRATAQGIVTQTRIIYYQVLIASEQQRLLQAQLNRIAENISETEKLHAQGYIDDYPLLQLEVQRSNLAPQLTTATYGVENAKRELLDVLGLPLHLEFEVVGDLKSFNIFSATYDNSDNKALKEVDRLVPFSELDDNQLTDDILNFRGDVRILDIQKQLQLKNLKAKISDYLPSLIANYSLNWTASQPNAPVFFGNPNQRARSQVLALSLQMPLFQGFRRNADVQMTRIQIKDLELQQYQTKQNAEKEILNSRQAILEAYQTSTARQKALELAQKGYDRVLIRYKNGLGSQQEINDADLQLRQAETGYAQMVFSYLMAKAQYDQALGQVPFVGDDVHEIKENIELK